MVLKGEAKGSGQVDDEGLSLGLGPQTASPSQEGLGISAEFYPMELNHLDENQGTMSKASGCAGAKNKEHQMDSGDP